MIVYKNLASIDLRIMSQCLPKIDRFRVTKLFMALNRSILLDGIEPEELEEHDKIFETKNEYEKIFWKSCRELAKKDIKILIKAIENGKKGGRPVATKEEQQATLDNFTNTFGKPTGANEVRITKGFKLPAHPYFDSYHKTYPAQLIKNVEQWLVKTKLGENVDYQWIGKQIQNFNKRKTGKVF